MNKFKFRVMCVLWMIRMTALVIVMPLGTLWKVWWSYAPYFAEDLRHGNFHSPIEMFMNYNRSAYAEWKRALNFNWRVYTMFNANLIDAFKLGTSLPLPPPPRNKKPKKRHP